MGMMTTRTKVLEGEDECCVQGNADDLFTRKIGTHDRVTRGSDCWSRRATLYLVGLACPPSGIVQNNYPFRCDASRLARSAHPRVYDGGNNGR